MKQSKEEIEKGRATLIGVCIAVTIPVLDLLELDIDIKREFDKLGYDVEYTKELRITKEVGNAPLTYYSLGNEIRDLKKEVESFKRDILKRSRRR